MTESAAPLGVAPARGRAQVWAAFALTLAPTLFAFILIARGLPSALPAVLVSAALVAFVLARCYAGDPWARWLIVGVMALGAVRGLLGALGSGELPWWIAALQVVWSAAVIALLQAPAARAFLAARRDRRRPPRPAAEHR